MNALRYRLWRAQALFDTKRLMRSHAVREWWTRP